MKEYLINNQPIFYKTLYNSKEKNKFPQAILLNGSKDIPLLDIAKYVAKWIVSDESEVSLDNISAIKIDNGSYADLIVIDGKDNTIKKQEIEKLQERFSVSAIEENAKKIYIINVIEHATSEAINSLLKFLEEPNQDIYAIITCENINNVLPTIVSRCLNLRLKRTSKQEMVVETIKKDIPLEDALILANFNGSSELIIDCYENSKYISIKDLVIELFNQYIDGENILYFSQVEVSDSINNKVDFRMFLNLIELFLLDSLNYESKNVCFVEHKKELQEVYNKMENIYEKIKIISDFKNYVEINANLKMLLDSLIIKLKGE